MCAKVGRIAGQDQVRVDSVAELDGEVFDVFEETSPESVLDICNILGVSGGI